jgi:hypothetical protein
VALPACRSATKETLEAKPVVFANFGYWYADNLLKLESVLHGFTSGVDERVRRDLHLALFEKGPKCLLATSPNYSQAR